MRGRFAIIHPFRPKGRGTRDNAVGNEVAYVYASLVSDEKPQRRITMKQAAKTLMFAFAAMVAMCAWADNMD